MLQRLGYTLMKSFLKKVWEFFKPKCWYIFLLCTSTAYLAYYRFDIYELNPINARNLIFLLWLLLLLFPLFSEMEFFGIKVKKEVEKEVEKATEGVKGTLQSLQAQIQMVSATASASTSINLSYPPLPTEKKMEELSQVLYSMQKSTSNTPSSQKPLDEDKDEIVYLFKVRLEIETTLRKLYEKLGFTDKTTIMSMVRSLNHAEVVSGVTVDLISQVNKITTHAIHGDLVSDEYVAFVEKAHPEIIRQLNDASARLAHTVCPRCHYSGFSTYENVCPQCGYVYDD